MTSGDEEQTLTLPLRGTPVVAQLYGTYHHQVDAKGRVALPASFRRWLPEGSVVAPHPDHRLKIWTLDSWRTQQENFRRTAETSAQERRFMRALAGNSYPMELDSQGRMLLTTWQRGWTAMRESAVFVGLGDGVEIAAEHTWREQGGELDPDEFTQLFDVVFQRTRGAQDSGA